MTKISLGLKRTAGGWILGVLLAGLAGCAAVETRKAEDVVRERAQARWEALLKNDIKTAYGYLSPGSRSVMTLEAYTSGIRGGFWKSAQVDKVTCAGPDTCSVQVVIEYRYAGNTIKTPIGEDWIRQDSQWWYVRK